MQLTCQRYVITLRNTPFLFSLGYSTRHISLLNFSLFNSRRANFHRKRANYFITIISLFLCNDNAIRLELNQKSPINYRTVQFLYPIYSTHVHLNRAVHRSHRQFARGASTQVKPVERRSDRLNPSILRSNYPLKGKIRERVDTLQGHPSIYNTSILQLFLLHVHHLLFFEYVQYFLFFFPPSFIQVFLIPSTRFYSLLTAIFDTRFFDETKRGVTRWRTRRRGTKTSGRARYQES